MAGGAFLLQRRSIVGFGPDTKHKECRFYAQAQTRPMPQGRASSEQLRRTEKPTRRAFTAHCSHPQLIASSALQHTKNFVGCAFEDVFQFHVDDIPRLRGADTPGERAMDLCNGDLLSLVLRHLSARRPKCTRCPSPQPFLTSMAGTRTCRSFAKMCWMGIGRFVAFHV